MNANLSLKNQFVKEHIKVRNGEIFHGIFQHNMYILHYWAALPLEDIYLYELESCGTLGAVGSMPPNYS